MQFPSVDAVQKAFGGLAALAASLNNAAAGRARGGQTRKKRRREQSNGASEGGQRKGANEKAVVDKGREASTYQIVYNILLHITT